MSNEQIEDSKKLQVKIKEKTKIINDEKTKIETELSTVKPLLLAAEKAVKNISN